MGKFIDNLTILFIALKLTETIDWSWWLVWSPMLVTACMAFCVHFPPQYRKARDRRAWNRLKAARAARDGCE